MWGVNARPSKRSNLSLCTVLLLTVLTSCADKAERGVADEIENPTTYPGAIEKRSSQATTTFKSADEAKKYVDTLEKQVMVFSSSDPDINIRKVTFKALDYPSSKRDIDKSSPFLITMDIEYEVSKTAKLGDRTITIGSKDASSGKELISATLEIHVAGSKAQASASLGGAFLVFGVIFILIGIMASKDAGEQGAMGCLFIIPGVIGVIYGIWLLLRAISEIF